MSKLRKRIFAFRCAGVGIYRFFRDETHPKIHLFATVCVIAAGAFFGVSPLEWCLLLICIGGVLMGEAVNSAVEKLADRITREHDPLIGAAKDIAAGAVLMFVCAAVAVGLIILIPKIVGFFSSAVWFWVFDA